MANERNFLHLDANESSFFIRELTYIMAKTYDIVYPKYKATQYLPVSNEAGEGADTIIYRQFDMFGMMKFISNYADDLPRSDVAGREFSVIVKSIGGAYGYNIQEIKAAKFAQRPLDQRRAASCRHSWEQSVNQTGWLADGSETYAGLYGLIFQPNVTIAAPTYGNWLLATTTPDSIIADVSQAYSSILSTTLGIEEPNTCLMPIAQYQKIKTTPRSTLSDTSILGWLEEAYPGMKFDWLNEAHNPVNAAGNRPSGAAGGVDLMIMFDSSTEKLSYQIPMAFEQLQPEQRGLEYIVNAYGRLGGVMMYYPMSCHISEGI